MALGDLAPPGSSTYSSNTMHVGDGTWDKSTDTFLLPNLQGLNFATMRYNGMGNRFKDVPEYHTLILGHGVLSAITFMLILPFAIFVARYGSEWPGPRVSFKLHVYLQIVTVFLSTVILVLGWFAVGPERSLTNPHHGIGVAIYVLILFQFLYASCWFRVERRRKTQPIRLPLHVYIHRLLGRSTALLAFVEIALGLTLYGSPKYLFILYTLVGAFLLFLYLALNYHYMPRGNASSQGRSQAEFYSDYGSSISGSAAPPPQGRNSHWGRDLLAAGGMVGAYEWWKNKKDRRRSERDEKYGAEADDRYGPRPGSGPPYGPVPADGAQLGPSSVGPAPVAGVAGTSRRPGSQAGASRDSWEDDKYSERQERPRFGTRVLEATGAFAAFEGVRSLMNRRRGRREDDEYDEGSYGSALGGNRPIPSQPDVSRVQAGHAPGSPDTPRVDMGGPQPMTPTMTPSRPPRNTNFAGAAMSEDSRYDSQHPRPLLDDGAPLSEHIRELGPIAGVREWNRQRRSRREADRQENVRRQELENEENFNRRNSNHYPRPQDANNRVMSNSGTLMTGPSVPGASDMSRANTRPDTNHPPLPAEAGYSIPPPPSGLPPNTQRSDGYGSQPTFGSAQMPQGAVNPDPARLLRDNTAANESSAYGRDPQTRDDVMGAAAAGALGGVAANAMRDRNRGQSHSPSRTQDSRTQLPRPPRRGSATTASVSNGVGAGGSNRPSNPNSPPVSVQVKMHNDGRHVTLRRLNDEEAAAGREARRQDRRRRRASSLSSEGEGGPPLGQRYRREGNGAMRTSSQQPIANVPPPPAMSSSAGASFRRESQQHLPTGPFSPQQPSPASQQALSPPAGAPVNESGAGYATDAGTGTDVSAFADNRRRRRAERARREQAAAAAGVLGRGEELD